MKKILFIVVILLLPHSAAAQGALSEAIGAPGPPPQAGARRGFVGVRGGFFNETGEYAGPLLGVEGGIPISSRAIFNPNAEFAVADSFVYTLNADFAFMLTPPGGAHVWAGAGVGYIRRSAFLRNDRSGLAGNRIFGVGLGEQRVRVYAQGKLILADEQHFSLVFGVRF